jgi:hypothetical protein
VAAVAPGSEDELDDLMASGECSFLGFHCQLGGPTRRVVSHYFGRNKGCTRAIPDNIIPVFCRKHYQRARYRQADEDFTEMQMNLISLAVANMKELGTIVNFDLKLRKRAANLIAEEDAHILAYHEAEDTGRSPPVPLGRPDCRERWMLPLLGEHKSFEDVFDFIEKVKAYAYENKSKPFEFEILPNFMAEAKYQPRSTKVSFATASKPKGVTKRSPTAAVAARRARIELRRATVVSSDPVRRRPLSGRGVLGRGRVP